MNVWLIKLDEPLVKSENSRLYRSSMIALSLASAGYNVTWWVSDFDHLNKDFIIEENLYQLHENIKYRFVESKFSYKKSVSLGRLLNNLFLTSKLLYSIKNTSIPDIIVCSMPTTFNAKIFTVFAKKNDIPIVIDCRDMWPDIIFSELRWFKKFLFFPIYLKMKNDLRFVSKYATCFIGITDFFVNFIPSITKRKLSYLDKPFPLGYKKNNISIDKKEIAQIYWNTFLNLDLSRKKIIYFAGRINYTFYIEFKKIYKVLDFFCRENYDYIFVFAGSGDYLDNILFEYKNINNSDIFFPGEVESYKLSVLRDNSYLSIQPILDRKDYNNSLSNKFFENLSSGLPILTSLSGVTKSVLHDNRCGYSYSDSSELKSILIDLHNNVKLRDFFSKNALDLYSNRYSYDLVYKSLKSHIDLIVGEHNVHSI